MFASNLSLDSGGWCLRLETEVGWSGPSPICSGISWRKEFSLFQAQWVFSMDTESPAACLEDN